MGNFNDRAGTLADFFTEAGKDGGDVGGLGDTPFLFLGDPRLENLKCRVTQRTESTIASDGRQKGIMSREILECVLQNIVGSLVINEQSLEMIELCFIHGPMEFSQSLRAEVLDRLIESYSRFEKKLPSSPLSEEDILFRLRILRTLAGELSHYKSACAYLHSILSLIQFEGGKEVVLSHAKSPSLATSRRKHIFHVNDYEERGYIIPSNILEQARNIDGLMGQITSIGAQYVGVNIGREFYLLAQEIAQKLGDEKAHDIFRMSCDRIDDVRLRFIQLPFNVQSNHEQLLLACYERFGGVENFRIRVYKTFYDYFTNNTIQLAEWNDEISIVSLCQYAIVEYQDEALILQIVAHSDMIRIHPGLIKHLMILAKEYNYPKVEEMLVSNMRKHFSF